ncbi:MULTISPECIES: hypothetical protein [unclassified Comamonas]|uniref:hypothetical protein n=1 Tax=unclassified Comamonas TaxID=2638500 RepID=UPI0028A9C1FB|nr:hypothetical protein [Comamonas sp.]
MSLRMTRQHRGLRSYIWTWQHSAQLLVLLTAFWLVLWWAAPLLMHRWADVLAWAWPHLGLGSSDGVEVKTTSLLGVPVDVVRTQFYVPPPSLWQWWGGALLSLGLMALSFALSRERLPLIYGLRIVALLGIVGLLSYEFLPALAVSDVNRLLADNILDMGLAMLWLLPAVHALVLYIFPIPVLHKVAATMTGMLMLVVSIPLQAASLAWLAQQCSLLVTLPLYMLFSFLPQIAAQLGIYGLFMSFAPAPEPRSP